MPWHQNQYHNWALVLLFIIIFHFSILFCLQNVPDSCVYIAIWPKTVCLFFWSSARLVSKPNSDVTMYWGHIWKACLRSVLIMSLA